MERREVARTLLGGVETGLAMDHGACNLGLYIVHVELTIIFQTTTEQISQARDTLIMRISLQKIRLRLASRRDLEQRVQVLANQKQLRAAMIVWKTKLQVKQQENWRNEMRRRMNAVKEKRDNKLQKDAWAKWRQLHQSHLSAQHYSQRLKIHCFLRWKVTLDQKDTLGNTADDYVNTRDSRLVAQSWDKWRKAVHLKNLETHVLVQASTRVSKEVLFLWKQRL
jgi:protein SFI1